MAGDGFIRGSEDRDRGGLFLIVMGTAALLTRFSSKYFLHVDVFF